MPPLSILIWLPAACGVLGAILCTLVGRTRTAESAATPRASDAESTATQTSGADVGP